mgnify:CR=1 FL=1
MLVGLIHLHANSDLCDILLGATIAVPVLLVDQELLVRSFERRHRS